MKNNKPFKIFVIIVFALLILILSGAVILGNYIEGELENRQIGTYNIQSREASVNVFLRRVTLKDIVAENSAANQKFVVPEIRVTGIHILPFVFNDRIIINNLLIQKPEITVLQTDSLEEASQDVDSVMQRNRKIEQIHIKQLEIAEAVMTMQQQSSGAQDTLLSLEARIELWNLYIFSNKEQITFENHSAEKLRLSVNNVRYDLPGDLYRLQFDTLFYSTEEQILSLDNLNLSSLHSKYDMAKQTGVETDWYEIVLKQIELKGLDPDALVRDTAVVFRTAELTGLSATVFRDKRPPFPDKPDSRLPMDMLDSLPFALHSDSILIKNATVVYEEFAEESTEAGTVSFNRLYASIYNLGTIQDLIKGPTALSAQAELMNESLLKVEFVFPQHRTFFPVPGHRKP
jgi:hypothetical protein